MVYAYMGTIMMAISLAHISSEINLIYTQDLINANISFINSLVCGFGAALGSIIVH